jgi:hypothetical protein
MSKHDMKVIDIYNIQKLMQFAINTKSHADEPEDSQT